MSSSPRHRGVPAGGRSCWNSRRRRTRSPTPRSPPPSPPPNAKTLKHFFHRNTRSPPAESILSLPLLRDSDSESVSISSRLSLSSSSSSGPEHEDLPRLSLDSEKPAAQIPISLNRNTPRLRVVQPTSSAATTITRWDEEIAPFVAESKRNYIFGGICSVAASASIKALAEMKSINLLGVQQICRNSIALEQVLAAIPPIDNEAVQQRLDRVRTYYELLNLPFEALLAFITEHEYLFTAKEYSSLLKINVPGREIPADAEQRLSEILSQ